MHDDPLLDSPIDKPETLDRLWKVFIDTENEAAVLRIVSVLDWEDVVRSRLQTWLLGTTPDNWSTPRYIDYQQRLVRWQFPINYDQRSIDGPIDLDLHVALLARSKQLKFADLPILLSQDEIIRLGMKSAALWSLLSMAQQHDNIARLCEVESRQPGGAARMHLGSVVRRQTLLK